MTLNATLATAITTTAAAGCADRVAPGRAANAHRRAGAALTLPAIACALALAALVSSPVAAQESLPGPDAGYAAATAPAYSGRDLPGRVGRIAEMHGRGWIYDDAAGDWIAAERNRPVTAGDRLSTDAGARLQLQIGSTDVRLDQRTEVEFVRLDDDQILVQLHHGSMALLVRGQQQVGEVAVRTPEALVRPEALSHVRVDRAGHATQASVWSGQLRIDTPDRVVHTLSTGQRMVLDERSRDASPPIAGNFSDAFSDWALRDARADAYAGIPSGVVSYEMTGIDDLARHGRWTVTQEYGTIWYPTSVAADWAPYRDGRWVHDPVWGWTWVDAAPWGFAPFHYGRWTQWGGRWAWVPGAYVDRPVYAPALVAWSGSGGSGVSVSVGATFGNGWVGWMPLGPYDAYVPWYAYGPNYYHRINRPIPRQHVPQVPTGPIMYDRVRGTAAGVTVVPASALRQRNSIRDVRIESAPARERMGDLRFSSNAPAFGGPGAAVRTAPGRVEGARDGHDGRDARGGWGSPGARSGVLPAPGGAVPGSMPNDRFGRQGREEVVRPGGVVREREGMDGSRRERVIVPAPGQALPQQRQEPRMQRIEPQVAPQIERRVEPVPQPMPAPQPVQRGERRSMEPQRVDPVPQPRFEAPQPIQPSRPMPRDRVSDAQGGRSVERAVQAAPMPMPVPTPMPAPVAVQRPHAPAGYGDGDDRGGRAAMPAGFGGERMGVSRGESRSVQQVR